MDLSRNPLLAKSYFTRMVITEFRTQLLTLQYMNDKTYCDSIISGYASTLQLMTGHMDNKETVWVLRIGDAFDVWLNFHDYLKQLYLKENFVPNQLPVTGGR